MATFTAIKNRGGGRGGQLRGEAPGAVPLIESNIQDGLKAYLLDL